jgi:hypothetical protein
MAQIYSPKIVTDSLVMCLDASNNKSYPTDLPVKNGLVMWMDAADDTTFSYSSGTTVSQWRDKSGFNYHMVPVSAGPTRNAFLNSRKVIACTTSQQIWNSSINLSTSIYTIFGVTRLTGTTNSRVLTTQYVASAGGNWLLGHWGGYVNQYYAEGWVAGPYGTAANTAWNIFMGDWSGSSTDLANLYTNGTAIATNSNGASAGPIGLGINISNETSTCEAAEIVVFNRLLSATERKQVHTYLGQKWNISNTDRSIVDLAGNDDNGLLGAGTVAYMPAYDYYNKGSLRFDGSDDYVDLGTNAALTSLTNNITVEAWIKIPISTNRYTIYGNGYSGTGMMFGTSANTPGGLEVYYPSIYVAYSTAGVLQPDVWQHVVYTRNGSGLNTHAFYINGVPQTVTQTANGADSWGTSGTNRYLGLRSGVMFNGQMSSVKVYSRALSATEISQNYEAQKSKFANTIVQQGLVLNLDAGNPYSYAGAGTAWYDVSGNNLIFNSQGVTQTPFTTIGGSPCFDFNGSGYWECGTNFNLVDLGGDCTIIIWFYCETTAVRRTIFEKAGTSYQSYEQEIAVTWETANDFSYYSRFNPSYDSASTAASTVNAWNMVGIKMSTGKTTAARTGFYSKNGSAWSASYNSRSNVALVAAGAIRIGSGYAGTVTDGYIGSVLCYNRMLTDAEILQNYNATKGRFGL